MKLTLTIPEMKAQSGVMMAVLQLYAEDAGLPTPGSQIDQLPKRMP